VLSPSDSRAVHISTVLHLCAGDSLRVGVLNGARSLATVDFGMPGGEWRLTWNHDEPPLPCPSVDVLLALPRPKVMTRLWSTVAAMGVGTLFVTNAAKVERSFFDSRVSDASAVRSELIRGLEQAGDTRLPRILLSKRFPPVIDAATGRRSWDGVLETAAATWLVDDGDGGWMPPPLPDVLLVAHPHADALSVTQALADVAINADQPRVLLAIGPEGGWTDYELATLMGSAAAAPWGGGVPARMVSLGTRPLTTDAALIALLSCVKEATQSW